MSTRRYHPRGTAYPFWRVIVTPTNRGPVWIGDFLNEDVAKRADDDARLWLCELALLRDVLATEWHDSARAVRILGARTEPLPPCPPHLAGWLTRRGWEIPGYVETQKPRKRADDVECLRRFLAGLALLEAKLDRLENNGGVTSGQPDRSFVI